MIRAYYTAASGLIAQQRNMDIRSNNIANIQTTGFRKSRPVFADLVYTELHAQSPADMDVSLGSGSRVITAKPSQLGGNLYKTGNNLDFAINGNGYFVIDNGSGEFMYTRDGSFHRSAEQAGAFLVTASGGYVLDSQGNRIVIQNSDDFKIAENGYIINSDENPVQRIALVNFENPEGLEAVGNNLLRQTAASGNPVQDNLGTIHQQYLESSGVNIIDEMTAVIKGQRIFQLNARMIHTADEMEATANNLRT